MRTAVADVVQQQTAIGLDVINDGEQERSQYAAYVKERLTGFEGERLIRARPRLGDTDFPDFVATSQTPPRFRNRPVQDRSRGKTRRLCSGILQP